MTHGVLYRCQNPNCRLEAQKSRTSVAESVNPVCTCGGPMKRVYTKPTVRELSKEEADLILAEVFPDKFSTIPGKSR